ncbi:4-hydroxyphenylpyruvate dioxygenase [Cutibacterium acnes JCM 18918]|nr:4-hydroxyphenylpyruvate dioxygenase [Cutibacterium acnes JCM 18918]
MSDLSRLSLNTATAKHATLAECTSACAEAGLGWIGPWRDRIQGVSNDEAARIISEAGLKASTVCRGGFLTGTDADSLPGAIAENTRLSRRPQPSGPANSSWSSVGCPPGTRTSSLPVSGWQIGLAISSPLHATTGCAWHSSRCIPCSLRTEESSRRWGNPSTWPHPSP